MSNLPELSDLLNDSDADSDLVKTLRAALKSKANEAKQAADELATLRKEKRTSTLADVLKDKGVPTKAAKLLPADIEPTPEAVDAWLAEFGDLFGIEQKAQTNATAEQQAAAAAITGASAGAPVANGSQNVDELVARLSSATTQAELDAAMAAAGLTLTS